MKTFLVHGVPASVRMDGWWMQPSSHTPRAHKGNEASMNGIPPRLWVLIGLVSLSDLLIWQVTAPGLSLVLFGVAVLIAAWEMAGRKGGAGVLVGLVLFLPAVERVQALSLTFWLLGLAFGAGWIGLARWPGLGRWVVAAGRFFLHAPQQVFTDLHSEFRGTSLSRRRVDAKGLIVGWAVPVGLGLLFVSLLVQANPVFEGWLDQFSVLTWFPNMSIARVLFWLVIGCLCWPFLSLSRMQQRLSLDFGTVGQAAVPAILNGASVRRSLILFNLVFALQTITDATFLWGHAALPEGMTYAQYAHRGAYPLLVTALLAGGFALVARPFTRNSLALKLALLGWVAQTLLLIFSSLTRLETYISAYGLTHLRLAALVWMALVAVGLLLVIWQVLRDRSAGWLLARVALLGLAALYASSFLSFAATIATYNFDHEVQLDRSYTCGLDRAALPVIRAHEMATGEIFCTVMRPMPPNVTDWREWGFRDWRVTRSLAALTKAESAKWSQY